MGCRECRFLYRQISGCVQAQGVLCAQEHLWYARSDQRSLVMLSLIQLLLIAQMAQEDFPLVPGPGGIDDQGDLPKDPRPRPERPLSEIWLEGWPSAKPPGGVAGCPAAAAPVPPWRANAAAASSASSGAGAAAVAPQLVAATLSPGSATAATLLPTTATAPPPLSPTVDAGALALMQLTPKAGFGTAAGAATPQLPQQPLAATAPPTPWPVVAAASSPAAASGSGAAATAVPAAPPPRRQVPAKARPCVTQPAPEPAQPVAAAQPAQPVAAAACSPGAASSSGPAAAIADPAAPPPIWPAKRRRGTRQTIDQLCTAENCQEYRELGPYGFYFLPVMLGLVSRRSKFLIFLR